MKTVPIRLSIKLLVLTITGCGICLSGRAQEITVNIGHAVHVTWPTTTNKAYQVETSANLPGDWAPVGSLVEGTGGRVGSFFDAASAQTFFRVREMPASGIDWLEGLWEGETYQASSNSIPFTTRMSILNNNRMFSAIYSAQGVTCNANLQLVFYSDSEARFYSAVQSGPCLSGFVILTRVNTTNVLSSWYHPDGPTLASSFAVLSRR